MFSAPSATARSKLRGSSARCCAAQRADPQRSGPRRRASALRLGASAAVAATSGCWAPRPEGSTSGAPPPSAHGTRTTHLTNAIVHVDDPEFSYRFIADELEDAGHAWSANRVARLCNQQQVFSTTIRRKRRKGTRPGSPVHDQEELAARTARTRPPLRRRTPPTRTATPRPRPRTRQLNHHPGSSATMLEPSENHLGSPLGGLHPTGSHKRRRRGTHDEHRRSRTTRAANRRKTLGGVRRRGPQLGRGGGHRAHRRTHPVTDTRRRGRSTSESSRAPPPGTTSHTSLGIVHTAPGVILVSKELPCPVIAPPNTGRRRSVRGRRGDNSVQIRPTVNALSDRQFAQFAAIRPVRAISRT